MHDEHRKVTASHLGRRAYLYVRQSTLRQVLENTESTQRQYALKERAVALGWQAECVTVIDSDLGQSGATSDREGFQQLVSEVSLGRAGIVLGLEVSRLARNCSDWHRLLEICALTNTLILDEDGLYNPSQYNDRLLLGLKGQLSEAELHLLRARLQGGLLNKAKRGDLKTPLPVGLVYDALNRVQLDPDAQVQQSLRLLFEIFEQTGSAGATVRGFAERELLFPSRPRSGPGKGALTWRPLTHWRTLQVLHNPRYAGAFAYGRRRSRKMPDGRVQSVAVGRGDWIALLLNHHPGYIDWQRFETHCQQLTDNARAQGSERRRSPPREGPALLQGLAVCGVCGRRMGVRYGVRQGQLAPIYVCNREGIAKAEGPCQSIPGAGLERAIGTLLLERMTPLALELALQVQADLKRRDEEADQWRAQKVQRAREEADLARRRYEQVDPNNRLVASVLEADWNARLAAVDEARREYERRRAEDRLRLGEQERERVLALARDFPRLWNHPDTPARERKRMVRLLIEDVTLTRGERIAVGVRLRGGATEEFEIALEPRACDRYRTPPALVAEIDSLLEEHTDAATAAILNQRGRRRLKGGGSFAAQHVQRVRRTYGLDPRRKRLLERGLLPLQEMSRRLGVSSKTVKEWRRRGRLTGHVCNGRGERLYEWPDVPPVPSKGGRPPKGGGKR